ncbi:MAG: hypothetical protein ACXAC5_03955 [Promethearchaeota archaeon]
MPGYANLDRRVKPKHTVKISMKRRNIVIETLDDTRISHHGGSTYLIRYRPKEIAITQRAKNALMECPEVRQRAGLEFLSGNVLAWAGLEPNLIVPLKHVSVQECIKPTIEKFDIVDK